MAYTTERTQEIFAAAVAIVESFGIKRLDSMSASAAKAQLVAMAYQLAEGQGVTLETARKKITFACRRLRSPGWMPPQRGGTRERAGRPRTQPT